MKANRMQQSEVENFVSNFSNSKVYDWITPKRFVDDHGCDGYIFKSELAAIRYIYGEGLQNAMDYCEGAMRDEDWIDLLSNYVSKRTAKNVIENGKWEKVVKIMVRNEGESFFLSDYSGRVHDLENGDLLYY